MGKAVSAGATLAPLRSVPVYGKKFNKVNSLNLIRLVLSALVLFAHGFYLAGLGRGPEISGENLGGWAVAGFFTISGYLITASRFSNSFGTYLTHRVARIYPAFIVCLLVTVLVFAPIAYVMQNGDLRGYMSTETTPLRFLFSNLFLKMNVYDVSYTPADVPFAGSWNGSLWSLYFEFLCYLLVGFLGIFAAVRRTPWPMIAAFALSVAVYANLEALAPYLSTSDFQLLARLVPFFLGGAVIRLLSPWLGLHWAGGMLSLVLSVVLILSVPVWGGQLAAPFITYFLLWFSTVLPSPQFIKNNDISYGFYIYAWPVQQLLAMAGVHEAGIVLYDLAAIAGTAVLATLSWLLVERPVMERVRTGAAKGHTPQQLPAGV